MMSSRRVVVTGLGLVSPHGLGLDQLFGDLMQARSALGWKTIGEAPLSASLACGVCEPFDASVLGKQRLLTMDRCSQLAAMAGRAAWVDAGLESLGEEDRASAGVFWGTGAGGIQTIERSYRELLVKNRSRLSPLTVVQGMNNAAASHLAQLFDLGGACVTYSVACASAAAAIADAARRIRAGECELAVAGGSEAALPAGTVKAWQSMQVLAPADHDSAAAAACRPFDRQRAGLVLAEGAAALILESFEHAQRRGARIYAELAGSGSSCDHGHLTAPSASGQVRALAAALRDAGEALEGVGYVNAHGTATVEGDPVEISALRTFFGEAAATLPVSATKSMHGHLMGASGALEALITVLALQAHQIPPTAHLDEIDPACAGVDHVRVAGRDAPDLRLALSNSFAFGGSNVVLAFRSIPS